MAEQEQEQKLAIWMKANTNVLFIGGMAVLLLLRIGIYLADSGFSPAPVEAIPTLNLETQLAQDNPTVAKVRLMIQPWPDMQNSSYSALIDPNRNMFDPKVALRADQIVRDANVLYTKAYSSYNGAMQAISAGNNAAGRQLMEQALVDVNEVLKLQSDHSNAVKLKASIEQRLLQLNPPVETPAATPAATPA